MKLTLTTKEKILLAKYWIFKLEDLYGDNLKDYDEYKLYYLPLKSYHLNKTASDINDDLRRRYEILYKIPQKYYDIDYTEIRDKKFPKLFRVAKVTQKIKKDSKTEPIKKISYYDLYETDINKYKKDSRYKVKTYGRIWDATRFADEYIRIKKYLKKYKKSIDYSWLKEKFIDMNKFLNEITPKPISRYINKLLISIRDENISTEKSIRPIKENEAISLIERLKKPNYKLSEDDKLIIENKSFSNYSSNYLKQIGIYSLFDKVFAHLKRAGYVTYDQFELYTNPPSEWFKDKFINSFIYRCNHKKGKYKEQIGSKKFRYDKIKNIDGKHKKCFLLN